MRRNDVPKYVSHNGRRILGNRKLRDDEVAWVRENPELLSVKERAEKFGVTYNTMLLILKGETYRRLNLKYPPKI